MAMLTTRQTLTPTRHACPPDGHDDPRRSRADRAVGRGRIIPYTLAKPSQMSIDSHRCYSLVQNRRFIA